MTSERELKPCDCADWKEGVEQIDGFITMGYIHGQSYTAKPFNYCPWCGKERTNL